MPEKRVMLMAAGGHGCVVLDALQASGIRVTGIIDPGKPVGITYFGVPVLGGDEWLGQQGKPDDIILANGIGSLAGNGLRGKVFNTWKQRGFSFVSVQHPSAVIGREVMLAEGCQIMAGSILQCRVSIGSNAVINTRASVDHDCKIGLHAFIGPGVTLCGAVCIGDNAFLGSGAIVLPGISVGNNAIVAAGAVVTRDVPCNELVAGNPASRKRRSCP